MAKLPKPSLGFALSATLLPLICFSYVSASHARIGGHWKDALIDEGTFDSEPKLDSSEDSGLEVNRQSDATAPVECGHYFLNPGQSMTIKSKNYPGKHPIRHTCKWFFQGTSCDSTISITCNDFQLQGREYGCLTLKGGRLKTKTCNPVRRYKVKSGNDKLEVSFVTRGKAGNGFQCTVTALDLRPNITLYDIRDSINVTEQNLQTSLQSTDAKVVDLQTSLQSTDIKVVGVLIGLHYTINYVLDLQRSLQSTDDKLSDLMSKLLCEKGWKYFENSCYFFSTEELSWDEGRTACQGMNSDYVKISTQEEYNFINSKLDAFSSVGLNDKDVNGTYQWISDSTVLQAWQHYWWASGEPNDGNGVGEDCVGIIPSAGLSDYDCSNIARYICEMDSD